MVAVLITEYERAIIDKMRTSPENIRCKVCLNIGVPYTEEGFRTALSIYSDPDRTTKEQERRMQEYRATGYAEPLVFGTGKTRPYLCPTDKEVTEGEKKAVLKSEYEPAEIQAVIITEYESAVIQAIRNTSHMLKCMVCDALILPYTAESFDYAMNEFKAEKGKDPEKIIIHEAAWRLGKYWNKDYADTPMFGKGKVITIKSAI